MALTYHNQNLSQYRFLVTGGAGFIGSHIAEYLLKNGAGLVRVLDNMANGFESNLDVLKKYPAFEFLKADIRDMNACKKACNGIDYVSHQAALGSVPRSIKEPIYFTEVNILGFANMLQAAVENKVKRLVYASSSSVYGDEPTLPKQEALVGKCMSPYAATKKTNELYAGVFSDVYGLELMGFRYFNIFGPRQDPDGAYAAVIPLFVKSIINQLPVYINGDGEQTRDFTFVENAVQVNIKGLFTNNKVALNKIYNVAVGENYSVNYLYNACRQHLQSNWKPIYREPRQGDIRDSLADISLAREMLGYIPAKKFGTGLAETVEYFRKIYSGL